MLQKAAGEDSIPIEQFIATAVAEKLAALTTEAYLQERSQRASEEKFRAALSAVPDVVPEGFDQI
ncbi:toxin-antitoxin system HicB family antitoxin [Thiorhodovibrio winogradskyi]|uniref:toxin-antitoxin system HicB family antitoxin n=1 Tax=Thiorhodovibrio winogradskyi TaxID=77007 RepID=UPI002E2BBD4F|nr:toxin-antitoxin system HicB family antitoxin [Thiorhodovibrio winogradskyi]